jgi:pimeloyl-ACP methyl ester carboxylesterase
MFRVGITIVAIVVSLIAVRYPTERFLPYSELAPLVKEAAQQYDRVVLVAESFSSPLAIEYAASHPANLKALVICAGFASSPVGRWVRRLEPVFNIPPPQFVLEYLLLGRKAPNVLRAALRKSICSVSASVLAARVRAIAECDVRQQLLDVAVPILYIQAGRDRVVGKSCFEEIRRLRPDTVLSTISAPHLVLQEEPRRAAEIIGTFLRQVTNPNLLFDQG